MVSWFANLGPKIATMEEPFVDPPGWMETPSPGGVLDFGVRSLGAEEQVLAWGNSDINGYALDGALAFGDDGGSLALPTLRLPGTPIMNPRFAGQASPYGLAFVTLLPGGGGPTKTGITAELVCAP
jgi:hypothetical protein